MQKPLNANKLKEGTDFVFLPNKEKDENATTTIGLLSGVYAGVRYNYGVISFGETPNGEGVLNFSYNIVELPEDLTEEDLKVDAFKTHLGDVLLTIITLGIENMEKEREVKGMIDEARNNDISETDNG